MIAWPPPNELPQTATRVPSTSDAALDVGDRCVPVGELTLDRQQLPGLAAGVAEVAVGERQSRDPGRGEPLGEGVEAHLPRGAQAVAEDHHRRVDDAAGR